LSYIILRGRCCDIVLNVQAPTEDKIDDVKGSLYEELERVFEKFPKYHTKILLGDFNAKVGREDIFKPTIGNESLHEINNDNGVRVVNFATTKNMTVKRQWQYTGVSGQLYLQPYSPRRKIHRHLFHRRLDGPQT
jgi:hypothetical protein